MELIYGTYIWTSLWNLYLNYIQMLADCFGYKNSKKFIGTDILHEEPIITSILKFWGSKSSYMVFKFNLVPNSPISQKEPGL